MKNILVVWERMGHYHRARIKYFRQKFEQANIFTADLATADNLYKWKNTSEKNHFFLSRKKVSDNDFFNRLKNFIKIIKKNNINIVFIAGYATPSLAAMIVVSKLWRKKVVFFAESWYPKSFFKEIPKALFLKIFVDWLFVSGIRAKKYYSERLKFCAEKITIGYSTVDNKHFNKACRKQKTHNKSILLCVARFSEEKNLLALAKSFLKHEISQTYLLKFIGDGPLKSQLTSFETDKILVHDWVDYNELPEHYANADFFILPSVFEPWGLVVNEAMAACLPVAVSDVCGCVPDLVIENKTGFVFKNNDFENVFDKILQTSDEQRKKIGHNANVHIENYGADIWADKAISIVERLI